LTVSTCGVWKWETFNEILENLLENFFTLPFSIGSRILGFDMKRFIQKQPTTTAAESSEKNLTYLKKTF